MWKTLYISNVSSLAGAYRSLLGSLKGSCHNFIMKQKVFFIVLPLLFLSGVNAAPKNSEFSEELRRVQLRQNGAILGGQSSANMNSSESSRMYDKIVEAYTAGNTAQFKNLARNYLVASPHGLYADDCLYLLGLLAVSDNQLGPALEHFNRVISEFPSSNRLSSALFAKSGVFKKMQLLDKARRGFRDIAEKFPGSPEAFRAEAELKLMAYEENFQDLKKVVQ
jgi:TolA-binding protein